MHGEWGACFDEAKRLAPILGMFFTGILEEVK
jgi:hypothetical protein